MLKFQSITAKHLFLSLLFLTFFAGFVFAGFTFTQYMKGEAKRINLAGRERMLIYHMTLHAHFLLGRPEFLERERHAKGLSEAMAEYEEVIYGLNGSARLGLRPIHAHDKELLVQLTALQETWRNDQKPLLTAILAGPAGKTKELCDACHGVVRGYLGRIESFVKGLEAHSERKIRQFDLVRIGAIGLFIAMAVFALLFVKKSIIMPVKDLQAAAMKVESGDFDVSVAARSEDEIGYLAKTFNAMTRALKRLFQEKTAHLLEQGVLNSISRAASRSLTLEVMLEQVMDAIMGLEPLALEKKGAIFLCEKDKRSLQLIVSRNFSKEQTAGCGVVSYGECLCGMSAEEEQVILSGSNTEDKRHSKVYADVREHGHIILPLKSRDKMLGVLCLYLPAGTTVSDRERALYTSIADIISVSMQNAINHRQVAMLAQSLDSSNDAIVITDVEGRIIHVNPEALRQLGYAQHELTGQPVSLMQSPDNPPGLGEEIFRQTLSGGWLGEAVNRRKDGSEYSVLLTTSPVKDAAGHMIALVGIARDITERKKMEAQLREYAMHLEENVKERTVELEDAKKAAEYASKAKSEFLANMSHELRTPLNSILGFSEILMDGMAGPVSEEQKDYLNNVHQSGTHLLNLINDILDLSKVEAGRMELEPADVDVRGLVEGSLVMFKEKAMKHGIMLTAEAEDGIGTVTADERKLKQVLFNLLSNAMKFTPDGGSVRVSAQRVQSSKFKVQGSEGKNVEPGTLNVEPDADFVEISVADTGIGIAEQDIPRLFQPFQQLETSYTKRFAGTGLGLNLCMKFIELHGGRIWVESEPGKGSTFKFAIPREPKKTADSRQEIGDSR